MNEIIEKGLLYLQNTDPFLFRMLTQHRTHENKSISFDGRKYLIDLYLDKSPFKVVRKSSQCFHPDTRILTNKGYVKISEINIDDLVLTKDSGFQKVKSIYKKQSNKLLKIKADVMDDLFITEEHPVFTYQYNREKYHYSLKNKVFSKLELKEINKCKKGDFLIHPLAYETKQKDYLNIFKYNKNNIKYETNNSFRVKNGQRLLAKKIKLNRQSGILFGFFLSEGHTSKKSTNIGYSFHIKEIFYKNIIEKSLKEIFNITSSIYMTEKDNCIRILFNDRALHNLYKEMGQGVYNKKPLKEFYNAPDDFLKGLLYGIFCGDGRLNNPQVSLHIKSDELLYFTKWILSKFGYISRKEKDLLTLNTYASKFIQTLCDKPIKSEYSRNIILDEHIATRIKRIENINYSGLVYNLEIENDPTYIANGYIVHNCGVSEWLIGYSIDSSIKGENVLYILPTEIIRTRFVSARFNKTIEYSNIYNNQTVFNSINLKSFGQGIINFIGSNAMSGFCEFVAMVVIKDEVDYSNQLNLAMSSERQSAQEVKIEIQVGNPTVEDYGIDYEYSKSDKKKWIIQCDCGNRLEPDFFKHVVEKSDNDYILLDRAYERGMKRDIYAICDKCHKPFNRFVDGEWVKENNYSDISGYYISKMFSTKVKIKELVNRFEEGLTKPIVLQRFYNGDLGMPFTSEGAKITIGMLKNIAKPYNPKMQSNLPCVVGIDVGNDLTTLVGELFESDQGLKIRLIYKANLKNIEDLFNLYRQFNIKCSIIDSRPEARLSRQFVAFNKNAFMTEYLTEAIRDSLDLNKKIYKVDRTTSLDEVKEKILLDMYEIPECWLNDKDFVDQMTASTRIWEEKENSIERGRYIWVEGNRPDHFLHACFKKGTMILTDKGEIEIENIKKGMNVLTSRGYKKVKKSGITGNNKIINYKINGINISCTPDHLFYTKKGFKPIRLLTRKDTCCILSNEVKLKWLIYKQIQLFLRELNLGDIQIPKGEVKDFIIQRVHFIFQKALEDYTKKYGKINMEKYQKDMRYIIKIITRLIIKLKIWNILNPKNIKVFMQKNIVSFIKRKSKNSLIMQDHFKNNGIRQKKEKNYMKNLVRFLKIFLYLIKNVLYVVKNIKQLLKEVNFVQKDVYPQIEENLEKIMKKEHAGFVTKNLSRINIQVENTAETKTVPVYNLEIEKNNEYFANGILVHNCNYLTLAKKLLSAVR